MNVPSGFQPLRPGITIWGILLNKNSAWDELNVQKGDLCVKKKDYRKRITGDYQSMKERIKIEISGG